MILAVELHYPTHACHALPVRKEAAYRKAWIPRNARRAHGV